MFGRIFGSRAKSGKGTQRGNKSRQIGKRSNQETKHYVNQPTSDLIAKSKPRTSLEERREMFTLRQRGLSVGAIAKKLDRSSRTVYEVLTDRRRQPLPEAGRDVQYEESRKHKQGGQHRRRRNPNGQKPEIDFDFPRSFMKTAGPKMVRDSFDLMQKDPEFVRQLVGSVMAVAYSQLTLPTNV